MDELVSCFWVFWKEDSVVYYGVGFLSGLFLRFGVWNVGDGGVEGGGSFFF